MLEHDTILRTVFCKSNSKSIHRKNVQVYIGWTNIMASSDSDQEISKLLKIEKGVYSSFLVLKEYTPTASHPIASTVEKLDSIGDMGILFVLA